MDAEPTHALQYSLRERLRFAAAIVLAGAALALAARHWLYPALPHFVATLPCRSIWGIDGITFLVYTIFSGLPLALAALILATLGRRGLKILRAGQFPLPGEKVLRPTPIRRGKGARRIAVLHLCCALPFLAMGAWGGFQAHAFRSAFGADAAHLARDCDAVSSAPGVGPANGGTAK